MKFNLLKVLLKDILELLFYIKKKGSQIGHPNLEPEKNINLINEDNGINNMDKIIKDEQLIKGNVKTEQDLIKIINSNVEDKMEKIKSEIKNYLVNLSTKKDLKINEITDFMFSGKISEIWTNNPAFFRTIMINIDEVIKEDCEIDFDSLNADMIKLGEHREIINRLINENILGYFNLDIDTKEFENLKYLISSEFNEIKKSSIKTNIIEKFCPINYSTLIGRIYDKTIDEHFPSIYTENEYLEIIYSIAIPFIIEIEKKNYEALTKNLINQFQEMKIALNIKNKTKKY